MNNIVKSQLYQTVVDKSIWVIAVVCACFAGMEWSSISEDMVNAAESLNHFISCMGVAFFVFVIASFLCRDYSNKTLYCDILAGYPRWQVFFGRILPAFVIGVIGAFLIAFTCVVYSIVEGLEFGLSAGAMLARIGTFLLLLFRLAGEVALLCVLVKRTGIVYIIALLIGYVENRAVLITVVAGNAVLLKRGWLLGGFAPGFIIAPGQEKIFNEAGEIVTQYEQILPLPVTLGSILTSVMIGGVCLYAAYRIFFKQDMN